MPVYRVEVCAKRAEASARDAELLTELRAAGLDGLASVRTSRLYLLEGELTREQVGRITQQLLVDPVTQHAVCLAEGEFIEAAPLAFEVHRRPGVMDPVAESTLRELRAEGFLVQNVRTARRYEFAGACDPDQARAAVARVLANECIERIIPGAAPIEPAPQPPRYDFELRHVPIRDLDDPALERLSRAGHLFLSTDEMRAIQAHFRAHEREPTDLELETLAQTWSEHCVHKTLKSPILYRGTPMGPHTHRNPQRAADEAIEIRYENLLDDTIARATRELIGQQRGPECLSVFADNAGIIGFDEHDGIAFKVETHNHPSAIEPYGGAATGVGGCIRDVLGCGLGARPVASTDVFCVAPADWPADRLPDGVLHPRRVLRGVVRGVADYGNRMGIPTVNGAVLFDPRYLGNPLVYCGCLGLIPRDRIQKAARPRDRIVLIGGRTGRDGIHGATFSSAELSGTHADEFSHAVQIGNAITEKRVLDAILRARDDEAGCLYNAITDCGAGGLSSAVGEMGERVGAVVDLENVPLKYAGLRYDEIWISEAQERMVLAVPEEHLQRFLQVAGEEEAEATVIGTFGSESRTPRLIVRYEGHIVGDLEMQFLHHGLPTRERVAEWSPTDDDSSLTQARPASSSDSVTDQLLTQLRRPNVAAKDWIIRQYDHEVQGGSVIKPLHGPGRGPSDAAVVRPRLDSIRAVAIGCGLAPHLSDRDPYWMALNAIDEAVRNVVCVGADPARIAILDNFCWGRTDDPRQLGALVRACQACYDGAIAYATPFISGKDSLNNEFALHAADVAPLLDALRRDGALTPAIEERIRRTQRLSIPHTLLISAVSVIPDARGCISSDLKRPDHTLLLVGGLPVFDFDPQHAARIHAAVAECIRRRHIVACHDASESGWLTALAEMAIGGRRGFTIEDPNAIPLDPFGETAAGYVVEASDATAVRRALGEREIPHTPLGLVTDQPAIRIGSESADLAAVRSAWLGSD